jgi:heptosyltransferase-2
VAWQLRREKIDLAILFPNSFRSALVAWISGCGRRIGYDRYGRGWLLTDRLEPLRDARGQLRPSPVIDAYNLLARRAGCPQPSYRLELFTTAQDEAAADRVWQQAGFADYAKIVCLNPGAAFGSAKHWPPDYFATVAQLLAERRGCGVLVLCGPKERQQADKIVQLARHPSVHALATTPLSVGVTKACIRRADLLITTDSGPRHFAAAFDRPVITLFGPTHIAWTETYFPRAIHLQRQVPCGPCQLRVCPLDHRCMRLLFPGQAYSAAVELLERKTVQRATPAA